MPQLNHALKQRNEMVNSSLSSLFKLACLLYTLVLTGCDGKPPKAVSDRLDQASPKTSTKASSEPSVRTGNELLNSEWATFWKSGVAEIAQYDVLPATGDDASAYTETRHTSRKFYNRESHTIAADTTQSGAFAVIVQHTAARIQTGGFPTQVSSTVSVLQSEPVKLVKYVAMWHDELGITSKIFRRLVGRSKLYFHASEGTIGDGEHDLPRDVFLDDQLPLSLRSLNFKQGQEFLRETLHSQVSPNTLPPEIIPTDFKVDSLAVVQTAMGNIECWKIVAEQNGMTSGVYWFEKNAPNILVKAERQDGRRLMLKSRKYTTEQRAVTASGISR